MILQLHALPMPTRCSTDSHFLSNRHNNLAKAGCTIGRWRAIARAGVNVYARAVPIMETATPEAATRARASTETLLALERTEALAESPTGTPPATATAQKEEAPTGAAREERRDGHRQASVQLRWDL